MDQQERSDRRAGGSRPGDASPSLLAAALAGIADDPSQGRAVERALLDLLADFERPGFEVQRAVGLDALRFLQDRMAEPAAVAPRVRPALRLVK